MKYDVPTKRSLKTIDSNTALLDREALLNIINNITDARDKALLCVLFLSGSRISEIVNHRKNYIDKDGHKTFFKVKGIRKYNIKFETNVRPDGSKVNVMWFKNLRLLKKRTDKIETRSVPINMSKDADFVYPIYHYIKDMQPETPLFNYSRGYAYKVVRAYTGAWPHYLRDLRVFDLMETYGWSETEVVTAMRWESYDELKSYLKIKPAHLTKDF
jgi:integrase